MTNSVPSLKELAARAVLELSEVDSLRPRLPAELVLYLRTVLVETSFDAVADLLAEFEELQQIWAAMHMWDHAHRLSPQDGGYEQLLAGLDRLLERHGPASHQLRNAIEVAYGVDSKEWREYLIPHLFDAAERTDALGAKLRTMTDLLRAALETGG